VGAGKRLADHLVLGCWTMTLLNGSNTVNLRIMTSGG
jgi:hypothetical protein